MNDLWIFVISSASCCLEAMTRIWFCCVLDIFCFIFLCIFVVFIYFVYIFSYFYAIYACLWWFSVLGFGVKGKFVFIPLFVKFWFLEVEKMLCPTNKKYYGKMCEHVGRTPCGVPLLVDIKYTWLLWFTWTASASNLPQQWSLYMLHSAKHCTKL